MALIKGASNPLTKGINEAYGIIATGIKGGGMDAAYNKLIRDRERGKATPGGLLDTTNETASGLGATAVKYASNLNAANSAQDKGGATNGPIQGPDRSMMPKSLGTLDDAAGGQAGADSRNEANKKAKALEQISKGWNDADSEFSSAKKELDSAKSMVSSLGKVRDQYLKANDERYAKQQEAVAGNKTLIEKNQKKNLDDLADDTRRSVDNTNVMLGLKGASGGSAARAASRAIARSAGKDRASLLTSYGDQISAQNQEAENAKESYNLLRKKAYDWEESTRKAIIDEYNLAKESLDRLKRKAPEWQQEDIQAESDRRINNLLEQLQNISAKAKTYRDTINAKYAEFGGMADQLAAENIGIDAPAELQTPDFSENIDFTNPDDAEDFSDPTKTGKRVIKGYDSFGNPVYEDELAAAIA